MKCSAFVSKTLIALSVLKNEIKFWKAAGIFVKSNFKCSPFLLSPLSVHRAQYVRFLADISNRSEGALIPFKAASPPRSEVTSFFVRLHVPLMFSS